MKRKVKSFSHVWLLVNPWTIAYQAPLSMGFSRQEYWSGLPFSSPRDLPDLRYKTPGLSHCKQTLFLSEPPGKTSSAMVCLNCPGATQIKSKEIYIHHLCILRVSGKCCESNSSEMHISCQLTMELVRDLLEHFCNNGLTSMIGEPVWDFWQLYLLIGEIIWSWVLESTELIG